MPRPDKIEIVDEVAERLGRSSGIILTDYRGLSVAELSALRHVVSGAGGEYKVIKNTLLKLAMTQGGIKGLDDQLNGPTGVGFAYEDTVAVAKAVTDFAKKHDALTVKGGYMEGQMVTDAAIKMIAALPPREELIAKLLGSLQAPLYGLVSVLSAPARGLVTALHQISTESETNA